MPTPKQLENCVRMGWAYLKDGFFERNEDLGYFTDKGFFKDEIISEKSKGKSLYEGIGMAL